jgi:uncharacterized membrane protein
VHGFTLWLHVLGAAAYFGATLAAVLSLAGVLKEEKEPAARRKAVARTMYVYNPLSIGALGVVIMTGAFNLTDYKAALGPRFGAVLGGTLGWKLLLTFALIMVATGLSFGIGHRLVREEQWNEPVDAAVLERKLARLPAMLWTAAAIAAGVIWLGLEMTP